MLTEENSFRLAVVEPYEGVLPVANVIPEPDIKNHVSQIEAVKVKPKRVHNTVALVNDNENSRRIAFAAYTVGFLAPFRMWLRFWVIYEILTLGCVRWQR